MPGVVTSLTRYEAVGFATHPVLRTYSVLVHVVRKTRILCSKIADQPSPHGRSQSHCWFNVSLIEFGFSPAQLQELVFLIGETDELLDCRRFTEKRSPGARETVTIEDIIYGNVRRPWVNGTTYLDGVRAGLTDTDIIDLLYRDILGRSADPQGLSNYATQIRRESKSLGDVRKSLLESDEYAHRSKDVSWAPGAIFSQPLAGLAALTASDLQEGISAQTESIESAFGAALAAASESDDNYTAALAPVSSPMDIFEVRLPVGSDLFTSGWHAVEYLDETAFRWMETGGIILSPEPQLPCLNISLMLAAVYGAHIPMVDCYFDDIPAEVAIEERNEGFFVTISPLPRVPTTYSQLRIVSRVSGCPHQEGRGEDLRVISLNLLTVVIAYRATAPLAGYHELQE